MRFIFIVFMLAFSSGAFAGTEIAGMVSGLGSVFTDFVNAIKIFFASLCMMGLLAWMGAECLVILGWIEKPRDKKRKKEAARKLKYFENRRNETFKKAGGSAEIRKRRRWNQTLYDAKSFVGEPGYRSHRIYPNEYW